MELQISAKAATLFGLNSRKIAVTSPANASNIWCDLRDTSGCGVSEIGNGGNVVADDGKVVARVAYNGRVSA